jgi:hypothetical protein
MKYYRTLSLLALPSLSIQTDVVSKCEINVLQAILQEDNTSQPWTCDTEDDRYSSFLKQESGNMDIQVNENLMLACSNLFHSEEEAGDSTLFCTIIHEEIEKQYITLLFPTENPSQIPSSPPSEEPSAVPSFSPSGSPSDQPSFLPSTLPSQSPSSEPSRMPSKMPSSVPSESPSEIPSVMPSEYPSENPSQIPSSLPSEESPDISSSHFSNKNISSIVPNDDQFVINSIKTPSESTSSSSTTYLILSASIASAMFFICFRCRRKKVNNGRNHVSTEALNEFDNNASNNV